MKTKIFVLFLCVPLLFLGYFKQVVAVGSFELIDMPETLNATVGHEFKTYISFFYSGSSYYPQASFVGTTFPDGLKLGSLTNDGASLYNISYSGVPQKAGTYPLILKLTDDYGALLTKKVVIKITGLEFNETTLPHAIVNEQYSHNLYFSYPLNTSDTPRMVFYDIPQGIILTPNLNPNAHDGQYFELKLLAYKTGTFTLRANLTLDSASLGSKSFTLIVDEKPVSTQTQQPIIPPSTQSQIQTKSIGVKPIIHKETKKEVVQNIEVDQDISASTDTSLIIYPEPMSTPEVVETVMPEPTKKVRWYKKVLKWFEDLL